MKLFLILVVVVVIGAIGYILWNPGTPGEGTKTAEGESTSERAVVGDGTYEVIAEESDIEWSGQKPLIEGYINSGTFDVGSGSITVSGETATGSFTIPMDSIHVGITAKKPGKEGDLEGHLKSDRWFDVATYPTATFAITMVTPRPDSETTFTYDVTGDLTLKGQTHAVSFPAEIYEDADGTVYASASFEFDRTLWGLTASSGSFFDDLADNAVSDMVALSFHLVAK